MNALPVDTPSLAIRQTPEQLHPALWLAHQLGRHAAHALPTGHAMLDAELPGGGWPRRVVSELLLPHPGVGEIRLLSPCLADVQRAGRVVMLFDPPAQLSAWALRHLGLDVEALLIIQTRSRVLPTTDGLWALEQALKSGHVGAVLAWLRPGLRAERLRRLQLAAQAHDGPAFLLRELAALQRPTAAPLRLVLRVGGIDVVSVQIAKRRGPPLEMPLLLPLPPVLSDASRRRAERSVTEGVTAGLTEGVPVSVVGGGPAALQMATFVDLGQSKATKATNATVASVAGAGGADADAGVADLADVADVADVANGPLGLPRRAQALTAEAASG